MAKAPVTPEEKAAFEEWKCKSAEDNLRARGRAISPEEKREVVQRLLRVWEKFPDLRLGQLLSNSAKGATFDRVGVFYVEDRILCDSVEEFAKNQGK